MDPIPFAFSAQLYGTTTVYLNVRLQVSWLALAGCVVADFRLRAERRKDQICSKIQYNKSFERLRQLPPTVEHLIIQSGTLTSNTSALVTIDGRLVQGFLSRVLEWFFWRARLARSLTFWSTLLEREPSAFPGSSTSSTPRRNCWMIWWVVLVEFLRGLWLIGFLRTIAGRQRVTRYLAGSVPH